MRGRKRVFRVRLLFQPNLRLHVTLLAETRHAAHVSGFLTAVGSGDEETATGYLNTRLRGKEAVTLARQLFVVLNDRLPARFNAISDKPEGSLRVSK